MNNTINYYTNGDRKEFLYKAINKYHIYLTDFSFEHNDIKYNVHLAPKGLNEKWFVFAFDNKYVASNNVWRGTSNEKDKVANTSDNKFILEEHLTKKPTHCPIANVDLHILSKKQRAKVIKYILKSIEEENALQVKRINERKEKIRNQMMYHNKICTIGLESDEYSINVLNNTKTKEYELYCTRVLTEIDIGYPRYKNLDLNKVLEEMIDRFMENKQNFYDCIVYGDIFYNKISKLFHETNNHTKQTNSSSEDPQPTHQFNIKRVTDKTPINDNDYDDGYADFFAALHQKLVKSKSCEK
jgi:hypothetical protein